jgi:hypothetical protein
MAFLTKKLNLITIYDFLPIDATRGVEALVP